MLGLNLTNRPSPEHLQQAYQAEQRRVIEKIGSTPLSEIETLAGWRSSFPTVRRRPHPIPQRSRGAAAPADQKRRYPQHQCRRGLLQPGQHPLRSSGSRFRSAPACTGSSPSSFANGNERFTPLGKAAAEHPEPGEVIFMDEAGLVVARRWCWRQSAESAAQECTQATLFTIEAQHPGGKALVEQALNDLQALLAEAVGGEYQR